VQAKINHEDGDDLGMSKQDKKRWKSKCKASNAYQRFQDDEQNLKRE
jgi:hypothetical protein